VKALKPPKWARVIVSALVIVVGAVRCARPDPANLKTDPAGTTEVQLAGSPGLDSVLVRACGDCHSNSMSSGWYTRVPPFSSVIARGAREGRRAVNFAEWSAYSPDQRRAFLVASCADATSGKMPMPAYLRLRPDAKLSARDVETLCGAAR
jgi:hypothetical protein